MAESELAVILRAQRTGQIAYAAERADILDTKKAFLDAQVQQMEASKAAQKAIEAQAAGSANAYELQVKAAQKAAAAQIASADAAKAARDQVVSANGESAASFDLLGKSADAAKLAVVAVGAGVIAAGAGMAVGIKAAADYQQQLTLIHTQAGAADENLGFINQQLLAMAPLVGASPEALAQALYHVESAGFRGAQAIDIVRQSAELAAVGQANLEDTTQAVIGTMAAFASQNMTAAQAVAETNAIVGAGDMRMEQWDKAIATGILPTAASVGLTLTDVGAAIATLTDNVTPADEAGTRFRMTLAMMASPSGEARKAWEALGMTGTELADDMRKPNGFLVAITDIKDHLSHIDVSDFQGGIDQVKTDLASFGMTEDQINEATKNLTLTQAEQFDILAKGVGGGKSGAGVFTYLTEYDRLAQKQKDITAGAKQFGSAWEEQSATFSQGWANFTAGIEASAVAFGQQLLPYATGFINWLRGSLPSMQSAAKILGQDLVIAGKDVAAWLKDAAPLAQQFTREIGVSLQGALKDSGPALKSLKQDLSDFGGLLVTTVKSEGFADFVSALETYIPAGATVAVDALATAADEVKILATAIGGMAHIAYDLARGDWKAAWNDMNDTVRLQTQNSAQAFKDFENENQAIAKVGSQQLTDQYQARANEIEGITANMFSTLQQDQQQDMANEILIANKMGGNIDAGIAAGITANAGMIHDAVSANLRDALAGAQSENGIASPAKKWADQLGLPLAQGIAMGIYQGSSVILAAAGGVTQPPSVASTASTAPLAAYANSSHAVIPGAGPGGMDDTNELLGAIYQVLNDISGSVRGNGFTTAAFRARA